MEKIAERIKEIIDKSRNIVVLSGLNTMRETGLNGVRACLLYTSPSPRD